MKSILKDLFNGKILPYENIVPNDPEYHALKQIVISERTYFNGKLSADDITRLDKLEEAGDHLSNMESIEAFSIGFQLATKIMVEVFHDKEGLPDILKLLGIDNSDK